MNNSLQTLGKAKKSSKLPRIPLWIRRCLSDTMQILESCMNDCSENISTRLFQRKFVVKLIFIHVRPRCLLFLFAPYMSTDDRYLLLCFFAVAVFPQTTRVSTGIENCKKLWLLPRIWTNCSRSRTLSGPTKREARRSFNRWGQTLSPEITSHLRYVLILSLLEDLTLERNPTIISVWLMRTFCSPIFLHVVEIYILIYF